MVIAGLIANYSIFIIDYSNYIYSILDAVLEANIILFFLSYIRSSSSSQEISHLIMEDTTFDKESGISCTFQ